MSVKLLTEQHLEFLSLKGDWTGLSEYTLFKMLHCWKSCRGSFVMNSRKRVSSVCRPGISISNKKGPNSFSAVFMKLNLPNDDLK